MLTKHSTTELHPQHKKLTLFQSVSQFAGPGPKKALLKLGFLGGGVGFFGFFPWIKIFLCNFY
jgi:hypothetical protein